jgi:hypothetical protein
MSNDKKYPVELIESERGWGQRLDETKEFDTEGEALEYIKQFNAKNNLTYVPDWYMYARQAW